MFKKIEVNNIPGDNKLDSSISNPFRQPNQTKLLLSSSSPN